MELEFYFHLQNAKQKKQAIVWLVLFYMQKRTGEFLTKAPDKIFFFDALIFSLSYLQTKSGRRKFKKTLNSVFSGPKVLSFS